MISPASAGTFEITAPPYEWATSTTGPSTVRTRSPTAAASVANPRNGLAAAITGCPAFASESTTELQLADSANAPWTRTMIGFMRSPCAASRLRGYELAAEPVLEAGRGDARAAARREGVVVELGTEVASVDVGDDLARIVVRLEEAGGELVEAEPLWTAQLDDVVQRRTHRSVGERGGDV